MTHALPTLLVHRTGSGPPLLLLPGLGSPWAEFGTVLPALSRRFDVLAVDLPGQGGSPSLPASVRPDVAALTDAVERELDRQEVAEPHVLGVSLGGRIGLELARRQRARSVVAISPTGPVTPPERAYQVLLLTLARLGFAALAPAADPLLRSPLLRTAALGLLRARGWQTPPEEAIALVRTFARSPDFWRLLSTAVVPEAAVDYRAVRCPVVIAQGSLDVLSLSQAAWLAVLVPGARYRLLPLAGHSAVADVPDQVVDLVVAIVDEADGG